jgi:hypothetical protein
MLLRQIASATLVVTIALPAAPALAQTRPLVEDKQGFDAPRAVLSPQLLPATALNPRAFRQRERAAPRPDSRSVQRDEDSPRDDWQFGLIVGGAIGLGVGLAAAVVESLRAAYICDSYSPGSADASSSCNTAGQNAVIGLGVAGLGLAALSTGVIWEILDDDTPESSAAGTVTVDSLSDVGWAPGLGYSARF